MTPKSTKYYWEHRDQCRENTRRYVEKNKEKIKEKQRQHYYKVLKPQRQRDRIWNNADKPYHWTPPKPTITKTRTYFGPKLDVTAKEIPVPEPKGRLTFQTDITIDWS
jgi:restriction endonuclease S subunit